MTVARTLSARRRAACVDSFVARDERDARVAANPRSKGCESRVSARDSRRTRPLDRRVVDARSTLDCRFPAVAMISRQVPSGAALAGAPLEDRVKGHSDFFDRLVELIPAKYYVPDEQNPEWSKFNKSKSAGGGETAGKSKALRAAQPVNAQSTREDPSGAPSLGGARRMAGRGRRGKQSTSRRRLRRRGRWISERRQRGGQPSLR